MQSVYYLKGDRLMLTCIYHPIDAMRVVEACEADKLKASGVWFDSPKKAADYRLKVENEIKQKESEEANVEKPISKIKRKSK
jgi:hypothetical protein